MATTRDPGPRILRLADMAGRYGVSVRTIQRWVRWGCPFMRAPGGRAVMFDLARVEEWLSSGGARSTSPVIPEPRRRGRPPSRRSLAPAGGGGV